MAIRSKLELSAYACRRRATSRTNFVPVDPRGGRNKLGFQCITCSYAEQISWQNDSPSFSPQTKLAFSKGGSGQLTDGREALCGWWGLTGRHDEAFRICREVALVPGNGGGNGEGGGGVNEGAGFAGGGCVTSSK